MVSCGTLLVFLCPHSSIKILFCVYVYLGVLVFLLFCSHSKIDVMEN